MRKNILLKMNLLVGSIIVLGFLLVSALNYRHNAQLFMHDIEDVADLTSEGALLSDGVYIFQAGQRLTDHGP